MGSGSHLANADIPVVLFDVPAKEGDESGVAKWALDGLMKLKPAPLTTKNKLKYIDAANCEEHVAPLGECDLVIERAVRMVFRGEGARGRCRLMEDECAATLDALETWLTSRLGKSVVPALDTPNFVANPSACSPSLR